VSIKKHFTVTLVKKIGHILYHDFVRKVVKDLVNNDKEDWDEKFLECLDRLVERLTYLDKGKKSE